MTGRRILLTLVLIMGLSAQASALPLIVELGPLSSITSVVTALGGSLVDQIPGTKIYLLNVPVVPLPWIASLLGIQWMETNNGVTMPGIVPPQALSFPPSLAADWYKNQPSMIVIRSGSAWTYSTGSGVVVADLNSTVDVGHPALIGHLTAGHDFVATKPASYAALNQSSSSFMDQSSSSFMDQSSSSFMDQYGLSFLNQSTSSFMDGNPAYSHGTLTAGVIAVVAPNSMIMPLRVFDDEGSADLFVIAKAIHHAVNNGAQVINMSFGTLQSSSAVRGAINYALSRNVVLVASAGNNNTSSVQYPAAYNGVIAVAATDLQDRKASFSNYGSYVFVDAPGVNIFSAYPGGGYSIVSGTSFSAPAVAGAAALILSVSTTGTADSISSSAVNIDSVNPGYAGQLGYGRIDVFEAVKPN